jgi:hypothetical protein
LFSYRKADNTFVVYFLKGSSFHSLTHLPTHCEFSKDASIMFMLTGLPLQVNFRIWVRIIRFVHNLVEENLNVTAKVM